MEDLECWCNTVWLDFVPLDLEQDKRYGLMQCQLWHYVTWDKKTIRHTGLQIIWSLYWRLLIMGARWNPIISFIFQVRTQTDTQACILNNPILVMKKNLLYIKALSNWEAPSFANQEVVWIYKNSFSHFLPMTFEHVKLLPNAAECRANCWLCCLLLWL